MLKRFFLYTCVLFLVFAACRLFEPEKPTGTLRLNVQFCNNGGLAKPNVVLSELRCTLFKGEKSEQSTTAKPEAGLFKVNFSGLEPASNYAILIFGVVNEVVQYRGYVDNISIVSGESTDSTVVMKRFKPNLLTPGNGSKITSEKPLFTWDAVTGAAQYEIQAASDAAFSNLLFEKSVSNANSYQYQDQASLPSPCYWRVRCEDTKQTSWSAWSDIWSFEINLGNVAMPQFSPGPGTYGYDQTPQVSITCETDNVEIYYTTNGSDPTKGSTRYSAIIDITSTTTLKARAFRDGWTDSEIAIAEYVIDDTVATPTFEPQGSTYTESQQVVLTSATPGAEISYSFTGEANSYQVYTGPIDITASTTLYAFACKSGMSCCMPVSEEYVISRTVAGPNFEPNGGTFTSAQEISIGCNTNGATIYYRLDGSEPNDASIEYTQSFHIDRTTTIKAIAYKDGWDPSPVVRKDFVIEGLVSKPVFVPAGNASYDGPQSVTMTCATSDAEIRYTTNGAEPDSNSTLYEAPVTINSTTTLKAKAFKDGHTESEVTSAKFTINQSVATPTFSPDEGVYTSAQSVSIECETDGAEIHYTLDGSEPNQTSAEYTQAISVSGTTTIKAKAFKNGVGSDVSTATYKITGELDTPVFNPGEGNFNQAQNVSITCPNNSNAVIYYTINGAEPTENSALYVEPITISTTTTLKAKACLEGWIESDVATAEYEVIGSVATPTFGPDEDTYTSFQNITISCATPGAQIRYTMDGNTEPTASSTLYSSPITVGPDTSNIDDYNVTIMARAFLGNIESDVSAAQYVITGTVQTPEFSLSAGSYSGVQYVSITSKTKSAEIYYTVNETEPTKASPVYTGPVAISSNTTLKAKAFRNGWNDSQTKTANYTVTATVNAPQFSPAPGTYGETQTVSLSCVTSGAVIYYTRNGDVPTTSSALYTGVLTVDQSDTIKARAFKDGWTQSSVTTGIYKITGTVADPEFSPEPGAFPEAQQVRIYCSTVDAEVYYTLDGTTPTQSSAKYTGAITISSTKTLKARAYRDGWTASNTVTGEFKITGTVETPVFTPAGGTYAEAKSVTINCATTGATIYYTTSGSEPTTASQEYTGAIQVGNSMVLKARAFKDDWAESAVATAEYNITGTVAAPVFTPGEGNYNEAQNVEISCASSGAKIYYTTDGSEPTQSSTLYNTAININSTTILKARAFLEGWNASSITEAEYTINLVQTGTVTDVDGNVYETVKIGDQWWMAENLRVTHYRNGDDIAHVTENALWISLNGGGLCYYNNNNSNAEEYGALYNWYSIEDARQIAPEGWRVPTDEDWQELEMYLGMTQTTADESGWRGNDEGYQLKAISCNGNNETGFNALPRGCRFNNTGAFEHSGSRAFFWTSTDIENDNEYANMRALRKDTKQVYRHDLEKEFGFSIRCVKGESTIPELTKLTVAPTDTTLLNSETLQLSCTAHYVGGTTKTVTARAEWSIISGNAGTIDDDGLFTASETDIGSVTIIADFQGEQANITFKVAKHYTGTVTDVDGNVYKTVKIGDQWWMAENLKVKHYRDGTTIPNVTDNSAWSDLNTGAYCYPENNSSYYNDYGVLYNWYAVTDNRKLAPQGWHVPTDDEWKELEMYLGMNQEQVDGSGWRGTDQGGKLKETGFDHWVSPNIGATNETGFTARPNSYRDSFGNFGDVGVHGAYWSASQGNYSHTAWYRNFYSERNDIQRDGGRYKVDGNAVRLVKD